MTTRNEITGDEIKSKPTTDAYRDKFDAIFNKEPDVVIEDEMLDSDEECTFLKRQGH